MRRILGPLIALAIVLSVAAAMFLSPEFARAVRGGAARARTFVLGVVDEARAAWQRQHGADPAPVALASNEEADAFREMAPVTTRVASDASAARAPVRARTSAEDKLPSRLGITLTDPMNGTWGVVRRVASVRGIDGTEFGTVSGGQFFHVARRFQGSSGLVLVGNFTPRRLKVDVEIAAEALYCFSGDLRKLSRNQLACLRDYYRLTAEAESYKEKLARAQAEKSPYFVEAAKAFRAFREKARAVENDPRLDVEGKRKATYELTPLREKAQLLNARHRQWKEEHAAQLPNPDDDPQYQALLDKREPYAAAIQGLAL